MLSAGAGLWSGLRVTRWRSYGRRWAGCVATGDQQCLHRDLTKTRAWTAQGKGVSRARGCTWTSGGLRLMMGVLGILRLLATGASLRFQIWIYSISAVPQSPKRGIFPGSTKENFGASWAENRGSSPPSWRWKGKGWVGLDASCKLTAVIAAGGAGSTSAFTTMDTSLKNKDC